MRHQIGTLVLLVLANAFALYAQGSSKTLFEYDRKAPLDLKEISSKTENGVVIRDVEYATYNGKGDRKKAFIIRPAAKGKYAGVLFFHWLGEVDGNRNQYVSEAIELAKHGTVSLLIQGRFPWVESPTDPKTDLQLIVDQTIEVRRALDLLIAEPNVEKKRIAYVGHDYGAMYGSIVAGIERRAKAFVLVAPTGSFSTWSLNYWLRKQTDAFKTEYRTTMKAIDPLTHLPNAKHAKLYFQFAKTDEHIPNADAQALYDAASQPKEIHWYDAKHRMNVDAAVTDRRAWLTAQLHLP